MAKRQKRSEIVPEEQTGEYVVRIEDLGPIEVAEYRFVPGRITAAFGSNGAGKSESQHIINAIAGIKGEKEKVSIRQGSETGRVSGFGRELNFTAKRCTQTGEISFHVVEQSFSLSRFVRPGFQDPAANDRQRLKDLSSVLGIEIDKESVYQLVGGRENARAELEAEATGGCLPSDELTRRLVDIKRQERAVYNSMVSEKTTRATDPAEYVAFLKGDCDRAALENEKTAIALTGEADGIEGTLTEIPEDAMTDAEVLSAAVADAVQAKRELERREETADDAERLAKQAEEVLKIGQGQTVEDADAVLTAAVAEVTESEGMIKQLQEMLEKERNRLGELNRRRSDAENAKQQAEQRKVAMDAARLALQSKVNRPTAEEWSDAERNIQAAETAMTNGAKYREASQTRVKIAKLRQEAAEAAAEAEGLRTAAKGALGLLVDPINELQCGIEVDDQMRLIYTRHPKRGRCPVEELSPGEAWGLALRLIVQVVGEDTEAFVSVDQTALEGLDAVNLKMLIDEVAKTKLMVFVAKASVTEMADGELVRDGVFSKLVETWRDLATATHPGAKS